MQTTSKISVFQLLALMTVSSVTLLIFSAILCWQFPCFS